MIVNTEMFHQLLRNLFYRNNFIFLFDDKEARILHACLSLPSSPTHQLELDVSKVFARDRGKEVARVSLSRISVGEVKRACFIIRDAPSILKNWGF